ncbi:FimB/Mfa2 family fimbrial subunit [uncultured Phocaeicola sp.]|uniref:FimB/Mfa2 family fimbrial subunit n=1 Tax=uncultured Phocaeicola sp. TaxID=990718 RepID=UPI001434D9A5|nr:FimB/Mfa2 family fimbrial subunit [uncultured Phocaeicola sp.]GFH98518.1 hypothetical protein IMSAGC004_00909 [Bacteroidaceae bacterium]
MNKKINRTNFLLQTASCLLFMFTACQKDDNLFEKPTPGEQAGEISLLFNIAGEPETRSAVEGTGNTQHVQYVQLYIFQGTGDNATCIASENIGWAEHFGNIPPTNNAQMKYKVKYNNFIIGNPYTFLAVGLDDQSGTTYGLPTAITASGTPTTLGNANAILTSGANWTAISQSELFAGYSTITPTMYGLNNGRIDMYRRVAGITGWFTHVPTTVGLKTVSSIRVSLYTQQNKSVPLIKRRQKPLFLDYIASPATANTDSKVLFTIPAPGNTGTTVSKGVYVLPTPAPPAADSYNYTILIEVVATDGSIVSSKRVKLTAGDILDSSTGQGTGIIDQESDYRFPIIANHFYSIGTSANPINLGGNI